MFASAVRARILVLICALILSACGGAAAPPATTPAPIEPTSVPATATTEASPTAEPSPTVQSNAIRSLEEVENATIQIEAQGSFVDPEVGMQYNVAGRGSGFIIDESGIAVTNNHVVTGAALLKVWVGGESEPRNAKVLGVSECADLAVIDIDGDGYNYLEWYGGDIKPGLDVYAAGFPLGDPEFTLTRGIVSKARANGESDWASVDAVIEHDATINPGNSGGPLVTEEGQVVAANYAGDSSAGQFFAIAGNDAQEVISQLRERQDVESIGINGQAVTDGESLSGIWVASVKSGSPADKAGIKGGDIITKLEGLVLATDGSMSDYCDILRSHEPSDTLNVEVLRFATEEVLEGQLNGRELTQSFSLAQTVEEEVQDTTGEDIPPADAGTAYTEFVTVQDDTGSITMDVPAEWADVNGSAWTIENEEVGVALSASSNLEEFNGTYSTPGVFFGASRSLAQNSTPDQVLDTYSFESDCEKVERTDYDDSVYTGKFDLYVNCSGGTSTLIVVAATPEDNSAMLLVLIQAVTESDLEAADKIISSFQIVGALP